MKSKCYVIYKDGEIASSDTVSGLYYTSIEDAQKTIELLEACDEWFNGVKHKYEIKEIEDEEGSR